MRNQPFGEMNPVNAIAIDANNSFRNYSLAYRSLKITGKQEKFHYVD